MSTLLLRLAGPLQSWGISSKFNNRTTGSEPSKSGVIGLLAAAQGRSRNDPVDDLAALRFGVRVDQIGTLIVDFHTARGPDDKPPYITNRHYLADAAFLVGLEGDGVFLQELDESLRNPYYPLFLGRRSCPPAGRISLGIRDIPLEDALRGEPWLATDVYARRQPPMVSLDLSMDSDGDGYLQNDNPVSFSQSKRVYGLRNVRYIPSAVNIKNERSRFRLEGVTEHDPFKQLRGD